MATSAPTLQPPIGAAGPTMLNLPKLGEYVQTVPIDAGRWAGYYTIVKSKISEVATLLEAVSPEDQAFYEDGGFDMDFHESQLELLAAVEAALKVGYETSRRFRGQVWTRDRTQRTPVTEADETASPARPADPFAPPANLPQV